MTMQNTPRITMQHDKTRHLMHCLAAGSTALLWPAATCTAADASPAQDARPNVLFIAVDDLRPQLGCYGHTEIISPNIDALAARGVVFNRAYCQYPVCGPSRSSLLTGLRPTFERFRDNQCSPDKDAPGITTLPQYFKEHGYYTISNGKIFHSPAHTAERSWSEKPFSLTKENMTPLDPDSAQYVGGIRNRGPFFESPDVPDNAYFDGRTCEKVISDLRRLKQMDQPFFLACGFVKPHLPWYAPKTYWDLYDPQQIALADNRFTPRNAPAALQASPEIRFYHDHGIAYNSDLFHRTARHGYFASVSYIDKLVGDVLAELDRLDLRRNTIIVLWGDHGWHLGEHDFWAKNNLLNNAMRTTLIVSAPGYKDHARSDGIVELIDLYPTLCDLAGLEKPAHLEGTSFKPLLAEPDQPWKEAAFTWVLTGHSVITRDYDYSEYEVDDRKQAMLFDLKNDPEENVNVADDPRYQAALEHMAQLLHDGWQAVTPGQALPGAAAPVPQNTAN